MTIGLRRFIRRFPSRTVTIAEVLAACVLLLTSSRAAAQTASSIQGRVTDESGAMIPGVTVTGTSPALQLPTIAAVTDKDGTYRFIDIPAGMYRLKYELPGFQSVIRDQIQLTVGFVARIDVVLKLGSLEESVTVSGQSPLVDVTSTSVNNNFTRETLDLIPTTRQQYQILALTPGITMTGSGVDVGGSQLGTQVTYKNYGTTGQVTPELEGIHYRQDTDQSGVFMDFSALSEFHVQAAAMDAEYALPGAVWSGVVKSGGNDFHGDLQGAWQPKALQSNNVDDTLRAQGITGQGNQLNYLYDAFGDLGGRIVRDRLWFYTAFHEQRRSSYVAGYVNSPGPDRVYGTSDDVAAEWIQPIDNETVKASYQASKNYKLIGFIQRNGKNLAAETAARFRPFENTDILKYAPDPWKFELQGIVSDRLLFNVMFARLAYVATRLAQPGTDVAGNPTSLNRETGWLTGPYDLGQSGSTRFRNESSGNLTYVPQQTFGGKHQLKAGYFVDRLRTGNVVLGKQNAGNYELIFDKVGTLSNQPSQIITYNAPIPTVQDRLVEYSGFVKDSWAINPRLTADLGLRIEHYHSFVDPTTKPAGQFSAGGDFPGVDVLTWNSLAPRVGVALDLAGTGKTVVKAAYGRYNHTMGDTSFAGQFDKNALVTTTYVWHDLNGNRNYDPGEANLDPNGPDFLSRTSPGSTLLNPNLKQPATHEITVGLERELMANFSLRTLYVYRQQNNLFASINVARPFSAYIIPITRRDPGSDGNLGTADDGPLVTFYDYSPAFRGAAFSQNQFQNRPSDRSDKFNTFEITLNKRMSQRWTMLASFFALKNHRWLVDIPQSPNDNFNPLDDTWERNGKLSGSYSLPYAITLGAFYQFKEGTGNPRTYVFRTIDPAGGTPITQSGTITLRLEPFGAERLPSQHLLNFRVSKTIPIFGNRHLSLDADLYNALNANTSTSVVSASGPTYGTVSVFLPPRVARLGVTMKF